MRTQKPPRIPLPKAWPSHCKSGICRITPARSESVCGELSNGLCVFRQCFPSTQKGFASLTLSLPLGHHFAQLGR